MKNLRNIMMGLSATAIAALILCSAAPNSGNDSSKSLKVNVVNFKTCVEQSKMGKQEQANFEALKKQMKQPSKKESSMNSRPI